MPVCLIDLVQEGGAFVSWNVVPNMGKFIKPTLDTKLVSRACSAELMKFALLSSAGWEGWSKADHAKWFFEDLKQDFTEMLEAAEQLIIQIEETKGMTCQYFIYIYHECI